MMSLTFVQKRILTALEDGRERTLCDIHHKSGLPHRAIKCEMMWLTRRGYVNSRKYRHDTALTIYRRGEKPSE